MWLLFLGLMTFAVEYTSTHGIFPNKPWTVLNQQNLLISKANGQQASMNIQSDSHEIYVQQNLCSSCKLVVIGSCVKDKW